MCESASSTDPAEMAISSGSRRASGPGLGKERDGDDGALLDSDTRICATEADALGIDPVISRCAGGPDADATVACLDSLVFAMCAAVERAPSSVTASETGSIGTRTDAARIGTRTDDRFRVLRRRRRAFSSERGRDGRDDRVGGVRQGVQDPGGGLFRRGFDSAGRRAPRCVVVSGDVRASHGG